MLFAGQAQKEFFVNEAFLRIDSLLHAAVEGSSDTPPASPVEGETWLVASAGTGDWEAMDGHIAVYQSNGWAFIAPQDGMHIFDKSASACLFYNSAWIEPAIVSAPSGGSTVDAEARQAIAEVISALEAKGIFSQS